MPWGSVGQPSSRRGWRRSAPLAIAASLALCVGWPVVAGAAPAPTPTFTEPYQATGPTTLSEVACPSPSLCLALGADEDPTGFAEGSVVYRSTDGGTTWAASSEPDGFGRALSCSSTTFCVVETASPFTGRLGFSVSNDGGLTWGDPDPLAVDAVVLPTLSCVAPGTCLTTYKGRVVSTTDAGAHWRTHHATHVVGVDCQSERYCDVVQRAAARGRTMLVFSRSASRGGRLAYLSTLSDPAGGITFGSMTCSSVEVCDLATSGRTASLYVTTDGGRHWSSSPLPSSRYAYVWTLSCAGPGVCTALVGAADGSASVLAASTADRGARWSVVATSAHDACATPALGCPQASTPSVACTVASRCVATVGDHDVYEGIGTEWTALGIAQGSQTFGAVACAPDGTCLAAGTGIEATSTDDGRSWTVHAEAAFAGDDFGSLVCPFGTTCLAAVDGPSDTQLLVSDDVGASWSDAALPSGSRYVSSITCPSPTTCLAVPTVDSLFLSVPAYLLRSTDGGMSWSDVTVVPSTDSTFTGVACTTTTHCLAVGNSGSGSAITATSDDAGATWTLADDASAGPFDAVSCSSLTSCDTDDGWDVYGSVDGGVTWTELGAPTPPDLGGWRDLQACDSGGICWGVLYDLGVGPFNQALMVSTDGGASWSVEDLGHDVAPLQLAIAPDGALIAVGLDPSSGPAIITAG